MESYRYYKANEEEVIKNFFAQPKPLQRLAFTGRNDVPSSSFDCVVVTDNFALIERGNITPTRGLHGIFPGKRIAFRWHYSNDSKKCKSVSAGVKYEIKRILSETDRYNFVEHVPADCLCSSVLRDILYGKITNPHDAIMAYGKKLGVKHLNNEVFKLASKLNFSSTVILTVINPAQLKTCFEPLYQRIDDDYAYQRMFRDMIEQAYALEKHINLMWSDKRLDEEHTDWSRRLMKLTISTKSEEPVWPQDIVDDLAAFGLLLRNTEQEVFEEGSVMHHCVYTNYWRDIKTKDYLALTVNLPEGPATIGMRLKRGILCSSDYGSTYGFEQCYHKFNGRLSTVEDKIVRGKLAAARSNGLFDRMAAIAVQENPRRKAVRVEEEPLPW